MGTTADKLSYILETKEAIKTSLINKGASVDDTTPFRGYASAIDNLSSGGGGRGVIWTEVDADGYPIKVNASSVKNTQNLFRYGDYVKTKEVIVPTDIVINTYYMCYQNHALEKINLPTEAEYFAAKQIENCCFAQCKHLTLSDWQIPEGIGNISPSAFEYAEVLTDRIIPASVHTIGAKAFNRCYAMQNVLFRGTPTSITTTSFANCTSLISIYVPWAEGEVANAPWGATNATIHYNTQYDENGNPITV